MKPPSGWNAVSNTTKTRGERRLIPLSVALAGVLLTTIATSPAQQAVPVSSPPAQAWGERQWAIGGDSGSVIPSTPLRDTSPRTHHGLSLSPPSPSAPISPSSTGNPSASFSALSTQSTALPKLDTSFGRLPLSVEPNQGPAMKWRLPGIL